MALKGRKSSCHCSEATLISMVIKRESVSSCPAGRFEDTFIPLVLFNTTARAGTIQRY